MAVMVHVATDDAKGRIHDTDLACSLAMPVGPCGAIRPDAVLVTNHPVSDQVVRHANQEDARHLVKVVQPSDRALLPPRAHDDVVADHVVHLIAVLRVDAHGARVEDDVLVNHRAVCAVHCDADLHRVDDSVPLEDALRTVTEKVEVKTVATHDVALAAVLDASVPDVHDTTVALKHVNALHGVLKVVRIACYEDRALEVDDLRRHL
mmetsp:Transcript_35303/g.94016  ORF Transcript_35303/g.94016 Transcript_35303/m.94016 type:complete len:207 (+) Transcript_35303:1588-2208(+)